MDILTSNMRKLSYGLYAIGAMDGQRPCGCIVNTVFQVTSADPIVAISMNRNNYTWELIDRNKKFSVSILSEKTRKEVIQKLGFSSGRTNDKYEGIDYEIQEEVPFLHENCSGAFLCEVVSVAETSTHMVILAKVTKAFADSSETPMTYRYYHEVIKGSAPKNAPSYVAEEVKKEPTASKERWICNVCGYVYEGDLSKEADDWVCPICGVDKSHFNKEEKKMEERWICNVCGYVYEGDLSKEADDWVCPICGVDKSHFEKE